MAAIAALDTTVDYESIRYVAKNFGGVEHRCELVRTLNGVRYYNSSIDSSPSRTVAALNCFNEKLIVLCGGADKHIPYDEIGEPLCQKAKIVITNGPTGHLIEDAVKNAPSYKEGSPELISVKNYEEATLLAHRLANAGDVVLLSPASTSFDAFDNFMQRGNFFKKLVNGL
jgi:UDP-N-acetylmuramoylalanine--D-glutamate ligase